MNIAVAVPLDAVPSFKNSRQILAWTPDQLALLKRRWLEGKSAADIAVELGNRDFAKAVVGKRKRIGLPARHNRPPVQGARKEAIEQPRLGLDKHDRVRGGAAAVQKAHTASASRDVAPTTMPPAPMPLAPPLTSLVPVVLEDATSSSVGVGFFSLETCHCRWMIVGQGLEARYCGLKPVHGSYCAAHARRIYTPAGARYANREAR